MISLEHDISPEARAAEEAERARAAEEAEARALALAAAAPVSPDAAHEFARDAAAAAAAAARTGAHDSQAVSHHFGAPQMARRHWGNAAFAHTAGRHRVDGALARVSATSRAEVARRSAAHGALLAAEAALERGVRVSYHPTRLAGGGRGKYAAAGGRGVPKLLVVDMAHLRLFLEDPAPPRPSRAARAAAAAAAAEAAEAHAASEAAAAAFGATAAAAAAVAAEPVARSEEKVMAMLRHKRDSDNIEAAALSAEMEGGHGSGHGSDEAGGSAAGGGSSAKAAKKAKASAEKAKKAAAKAAVKAAKAEQQDAAAKAKAAAAAAQKAAKAAAKKAPLEQQPSAATRAAGAKRRGEAGWKADLAAVTALGIDIGDVSELRPGLHSDAFHAIGDGAHTHGSGAAVFTIIGSERTLGIQMEVRRERERERNGETARARGGRQFACSLRYADFVLLLLPRRRRLAILTPRHRSLPSARANLTLHPRADPRRARSAARAAAHTRAALQRGAPGGHAGHRAVELRHEAAGGSHGGGDAQAEDERRARRWRRAQARRRGRGAPALHPVTAIRPDSVTVVTELCATSHMR
jgi:hypothetical protein